MLGIEYILASIIISKWFSILREPDQLFSWYNRILIGWDEESACNNLSYFDLCKPFLYKVLTCSLCHSGYLAIYFIFAYKQHFIILPTTMVVYYLLSKIKY